MSEFFGAMRGFGADLSMFLAIGEMRARGDVT